MKRVPAVSCSPISTLLEDGQSSSTGVWGLRQLLGSPQLHCAEHSHVSRQQTRANPLIHSHSPSTRHETTAHQHQKPTSVPTFSHPTAHFPFQHSRDLANCGRARPTTRDRPSSSQRTARSRHSLHAPFIHIDRCDRLPRNCLKPTIVGRSFAPAIWKQDVSSQVPDSFQSFARQT